jgi:hypothetical protein
VLAILAGGGDAVVGVPSWGFLAGVAAPFVSEDTAEMERWEASRVENMRVNRSFMDPFSAGFGEGACSMAPAGRTGSPFRPFSFGDLEGASTDLIDGGCDERGEADATEAPEFAAMMGGGWFGVQVCVVMATGPKSGLLALRKAGGPGMTLMQGLVRARAGGAASRVV